MGALARMSRIPVVTMAAYVVAAASAMPAKGARPIAFWHMYWPRAALTTSSTGTCVL